MSSVDIAAGQRWGKEVAEALESTVFGILCVTPDNPNEPWLVFEAGAMASRWSEANVCPYLFGMEAADLPAGPLTQFQAKPADQHGTGELLRSVNQASEQPLPERILERALAAHWPELAERISAIDLAPGGRERRSTGDMLAEVVEGVRELRRELKRWSHRRDSEYPLGVQQGLFSTLMQDPAGPELDLDRAAGIGRRLREVRNAAAHGGAPEEESES
jgi:hypothetical protein